MLIYILLQCLKNPARKKCSVPEAVNAFILLHTYFEKSCISLSTEIPFYMSG